MRVSKAGLSLGTLGLTLALVTLTGERAARACGGCFTPPPAPMESESIITDEKMVLSVSMSQTTLYDQISYSGAPSSFAWVLPIKGTVTVGLSADVMFQVLNNLTATVVEPPPTNCPPPPSCYLGNATEGSDDTAAVGAIVPSSTVCARPAPRAE